MTAGILSLASQPIFSINRLCSVAPATIKENVVFGRAWDEQWFTTVVGSVGLDTDLEAMPMGLLTVVGDRGHTLSGGQRCADLILKSRFICQLTVC